MDLNPVHWVLAVVAAIIVHLAVLLVVLALWAPNTATHSGSHSVEVSLSDLGSKPKAAKTTSNKAKTATPASSATAATSAAPASAQAVANQSLALSSPTPAAARNVASTGIPGTQAQSPVAASQAKQTPPPANRAKAKKKPAQKAQSRPANPPSKNLTSHRIKATTTSQKRQAEHRAGSKASTTKDYTDALSKAIAAKKRYPRSARRHKLQGHVEVRVVIQQSGKISHLSIAKSSGHKSLDQAALKAVRKAAPFGALPASMQRSQIAIIVPFDFGLTQ